jgi:hypothetical protein
LNWSDNSEEADLTTDCTGTPYTWSRQHIEYLIKKAEKIYTHSIPVGQMISKCASALCPHFQEVESIQYCFLSCPFIQIIQEKLFQFLLQHTSSSISSQLTKDEQLLL